MAKSDINEIRELLDFKIKILKLLTQDVTLTKDTYKVVEVVENGQLTKTREYNGKRSIECKKSDWIKGNKPHRAKASRERLRFLMSEIQKVLQEARKYTLELDKQKD